MTTPHVVAFLKGGKMVSASKPRNKDGKNFVITCEYGDWSGFLTLAECQSRYPVLEKMGRPDFYFQVEER